MVMPELTATPSRFSNLPNMLLNPLPVERAELLFVLHVVTSLFSRRISVGNVHRVAIELDVLPSVGEKLAGFREVRFAQFFVNYVTYRKTILTKQAQG